MQNSFNIGGGRVRMDAITETAEERCRAFNQSTATQFKLRSQLIRHPRIAFYGDPDRIVDCVKNCLNTVRSSKLLMFIAVRRLFRSVTLLMRWIHRYIAARRAKVMALVEHWESEEFIRRRALDAEMSSPNYRVRKGIPEAMQASQEVNVPQPIKIEVASIIVKRHAQAHWRLRVGWATRLFAIEKELVECKTIASAQLYGASLATAMSARIDWGKIRRLRLQYMAVSVECPKVMDCTKQSWGALHAVREEILEKRIRKGRDITMQTYAEKKEDERRRRIEIFNAAEKKRVEDYRIAQSRAQRLSNGGGSGVHEDGDEDAHQNTSGDSPHSSPLSNAKRNSSSASPDGGRFKLRRRSSIAGVQGQCGQTMSGLTLTKVDEQELIDGERSWNSPQAFDFDPSSPSVKGDTLNSTLSASIMEQWGGNRSMRRLSPSINQESASAPFSTHLCEEEDDDHPNRPSTATPPLLPTAIPEAPSCVTFDTVESHVSQQTRANIRISLRRDLSKVNGGNVGPKRDLDDSLIALNPLSQRLAAVARTKSQQQGVSESGGALSKEFQTPPRRASTPALSMSVNSNSMSNTSPAQQPLACTPEATILKYGEEKQVADRVLQSRRATTISLSLDQRVSSNKSPSRSHLLPQITRAPDGAKLSTTPTNRSGIIAAHNNKGGTSSPFHLSTRGSCDAPLPITTSTTFVSGGGSSFSPSKRSQSVGGLSSSTSVGVSILGRDKRAPVESMLRGSFSRQGPHGGSPAR